MCDMIFETKRGSIYLPYHLNDISHFDGTINEHYSACHSKGYYLPSTGLHFITGFLQSNPPHVLIPSEVSTHSPEKYWSTAMFVENTGVGSINFLRTGGNSRSGICANHGTFEILSGEMVGEAFGGRLVLDGGMS